MTTTWNELFEQAEQESVTLEEIQQTVNTHREANG